MSDTGSSCERRGDTHAAAVTTRRTLLQLTGSLAAALAMPDWDLLAAMLHEAPASAPPAGQPVLDAAELADVEALAAQIIPTDSTPGAREAGVAHFIDLALRSFFAPLAADFHAGLTEFRRGVRS